jgi:anti-sigma regulatory factor (Ser/Thr protein kinase)
VSQALQSADSPDLRDAAALCVSELVANVVRHTNSAECQLSVSWDRDRLWIKVRDDSQESPAVQPGGGADDESPEQGRGMQIVQALASDWGVTNIEGDGKTVWVCLS